MANSSLVAALVLLCLLPAALAVDAAEEARRVEITADSYSFTPDRVVVRAGEPLEVVLTNEALITPHNFVIHAPEAGIDVDVEIDGGPVTVRFTPARPGTYAFYCDKKLLFFKSHREKGMEGALEVLPPSGE